MKRYRMQMLGGVVLAAAFLSSGLADDVELVGLPLAIDRSVIGHGALSNVRGRIAVNIAAGDSNVQSNAAAVAVGLGDIRAAAHSSLIQMVDTPYPGPLAAFAAIGDQAFSSATGLISINQASGAGNAQANATVIGLGHGVEVVTDNLLARAAPVSASKDEASDQLRIRGASISPTAFDGARGLVQVNQSAGSANSTVNTFALSVQTSGKP